MAQKYPQIAKQLSDRINLDTGNFTQVAIALRKEIEALEPDGYDYDDFSSDDFDPIHERLCKLFDSGHPDEIVGLGTTFIEVAQRRYEYGHPGDWGIGYGIEKCLAVIVKAQSQKAFDGDSAEAVVLPYGPPLR